MPAPSRFLSEALAIVLALLALAWYFKDQLPESRDILADLEREPAQVKIEKTKALPFKIGSGESVFTVTPLYSYELWGLVVSQHRADSFADYYHKIWGDDLNVKDLCVVWGGNTRRELYKRLSFDSGPFTCYVRTRDNAAWEAFNLEQMSNNHLLVSDPRLREAILDVAPGDQIRLRGSLAEYRNAKGFFRGTSITRSDRGDGACETVFVKEFQTLKKANPLWRGLFDACLWLAPCLVLARLALFLRACFSPSPIGRLGDATGHHAKGALLAARGKYRQAIASFDAALACDPDLVEAYLDRALAWDILGDPEQARRDRDQAARLQNEAQPRLPV